MEKRGREELSDDLGLAAACCILKCLFQTCSSPIFPHIFPNRAISTKQSGEGQAGNMGVTQFSSQAERDIQPSALQ